MFSFSTLFSLLPAVPQVVADAEALLANPAVKDLEALIAANFSHTTTAGAASILEPLGTTVNVGGPPSK